MQVRALAVAVVLSACGDDGGAVDAAPGDDAPKAYNPLVGVGTVALVRDGYMFVEGPQWRDGTNDLLFSDIPASTIYRYKPGVPVPVVHRMPSDMSNGLALDTSGAVLAAEHGSRSVTRNATPIAATFEAMRLNSPNDVVAADDGTIYFTDPPYGIAAADRQLDFIGVFRIAPDGTLTAIRRGALTERPNGIGLSPDGTRLFVSDTADGNLYTYAIASDGTVGPRTLFAQTRGNPDGLAIDAGGNVFVATDDGIEAFSPLGPRWGRILVPELPSNCAFGDADHRTLYITARTGVYGVRLAHPGLPRR